jgi:O-antigen/teichoic acid export membrane protein
MWIVDASRRALRGPGLSILVHAAGLGVGLVANAFLARWLSPVGYGIYGFAFGLVFVISVPLHTGLATLVMRDAAQDVARRDYARLAGLVRGAPMFALACSLLGALVLLLVAWRDPWGKLADYSAAIAVATLLLPGLSLAAIAGAVLRGIGNPMLGQLPDAFVRPLLFAVAVGMAWWLGVAADGRVALTLHAVAAALAISLGVVLVATRLPKEVFHSKPNYAWRARMSALAPLSLLAGIQAVGSFVATASLGLSHSPDVVGTYRLAELGGSLAAMPLGAVSAYAAGGFARTHAMGDNARLQRDVSHAARISLFTVLPVAFVMFIAGKAAVQVAVGPAYVDAVVPMMILCLGQIANALAGPAGAVATMSGHHRQAVIAVGIALAVQVLLNVVLVPKYGSIGAAIATAASTIAWSHGLRLRVLRLTGVSTSPLHALGKR